MRIGAENIERRIGEFQSFFPGSSDRRPFPSSRGSVFHVCSLEHRKRSNTCLRCRPELGHLEDSGRIDVTRVEND